MAMRFRIEQDTDSGHFMVLDPERPISLGTFTDRRAAIAFCVEQREAKAADTLGETPPSNLIQVIEFCKKRGLPADVVGRWVWLRFDGKPSESTREVLKAAGFKWVKTRGEWAHNCGHPSHHGSGAPRFKYGSVPVSELETAGIE